MNRNSTKNLPIDENDLPYYARPFLKECISDIQNNLPSPSDAEIVELAKTKNSSDFLHSYWGGGMSCFVSISILLKKQENFEKLIALMKQADIDITVKEDDLAKHLVNRIEIFKDLLKAFEESLENTINEENIKNKSQKTNYVSPAKVEDFTEDNLIIALSMLIMTAISRLKIAEEKITSPDFREGYTTLNKHLNEVVFWNNILIHLKRARESVNPKVKKIIEGKYWKTKSMKKKDNQYDEFIDWALSRNSMQKYRYPREALMDFIAEKEKFTRTYDYLKATPRSCDTFIRKLKEHCESKDIDHPFPPINK